MRNVRAESDPSLQLPRRSFGLAPAAPITAPPYLRRASDRPRYGGWSWLLATLSYPHWAILTTFSTDAEQRKLVDGSKLQLAVASPAPIICGNNFQLKLHLNRLVRSAPFGEAFAEHGLRFFSRPDLPLCEVTFMEQGNITNFHTLGDCETLEERLRPPGSATEPVDARDSAESAAPSDWNQSSVPLTLDEFCERVGLLAKLDLSCVVYIANASVEQTCTGVIREVHQSENRLVLLGDDFSLLLNIQNVGSVWLVNSVESGKSTNAVEIHNKSGELITRVFGLDEGVSNAVWHDVMANPTLSMG